MEYIVILIYAILVFFYFYGKIDHSKPAKIQTSNRKSKETMQYENGKWYVEVVGESFNNDDGSSRQNIIKQYVNVGDPANLRFYDYEGSIACAVDTKHGQIGHLSKEDAKKLYGMILKGKKVGAGVESVGKSGTSGLYGVSHFMVEK